MLSHQNITKQINSATYTNKERVNHTKEAIIINRIKINSTGNCFITFKDYKKEHFKSPDYKITKSCKK